MPALKAGAGALVRTGRTHGAFRENERAYDVVTAHTRRKLWGTTHDVTYFPKPSQPKMNRFERRLAGKDARHAAKVRAFTRPGPNMQAAYVLGGTTAGTVGAVTALDQHKARLRKEAAARRVTKASSRDYAEIGAGGTVLGGSLAISPLENRYNARVDRKHKAAVSRLRGAYGLDAKGRLVPTNPWGPGAPRKQKTAAKEMVRAKHRAIHELNRTVKAKRIPMAHRTGRGWAGAALAAPLLWHGTRSAVDKKVTRRDVDRGAVGAAGATGAYHALHYGVMPLDRRNERKIADDARLRTKARAYRSASKLPRNAQLGDPRWVEYFRNYPKDLPGGRMKRAFSHTHAGGRGGAVALGLASLGAGVNVARGRQVHKSLYEREHKTSVLRAGGTVAGAGLLAWGVPRHRFLGPALARGVKAATKHESEAALEALRLAESAAGTLRGVTGHAERRLRTIQHVDQAINRVPRSIRPEVATAAGLILVGQSHPVRRTKYTPVLVGGGY